MWAQARWLAPAAVAAVAAALWLARRSGSAEELPRYVFLEQHDGALRRAFGQQAACLRRSCWPFLQECLHRDKCLKVLDQLLEDRCVELPRLCGAVGLERCPPSASNLWGCWQNLCRENGDVLAAFGAYKAAAAVPLPEFVNVFAARDAAIAEHASLGLKAAHERNFGEKGGEVEGTEERESHGHSAMYLHAQAPTAFPKLLGRLLAAARQADQERGWGVWERLQAAGIQVPGIRCIELITYNSGAGHDHQHEGGKHAEESGDEQSIGWHFDNGSILTVALMLSASGDYDGGSFEIRPSREDCMPVATQTVDAGDVLVWESWRPHRVTPVTRGNRLVLVVEIWEFANTTHIDARRPDVPVDFRKSGVALWGAREDWAWTQLTQLHSH